MIKFYRFVKFVRFSSFDLFCASAEVLVRYFVALYKLRYKLHYVMRF